MVVISTNDEQRRRLTFWYRIAGQIGTSPAWHHGAEILWKLCRCDESRTSAGARAEIAHAQIACLLLLFCPSCGVNEAFRQQTDIESVLTSAHVHRFLFLREQI